MTSILHSRLPMYRLATTQLRATGLTIAGPSVARTFTVSARRLRSDDGAPSSSQSTAPDTDTTSKSTASRKKSPESKPTDASASADDKLRKSALTVAEQDALMFATLDGREGAGAGNEIKDGAWESGMTKFTRRNQYRVI